MLPAQRGGASDASHFSAAGIALTIDGLGPRGGHAHAPEEFVDLDSLMPRAEVALLVLLGFGVAGLVLSAKPGTAHRITMAGVAILTVGLVTIAVIGAFAARLKGAPGSVALGSNVTHGVSPVSVATGARSNDSTNALTHGFSTTAK